MTSTLPSHVKVTVHQVKGISGKGYNSQSGLFVVLKTVQHRFTTAKHVAPEWNEDFEFPLQGLDTVVKVSLKCKGKLGDEKSIGSTFVSLKDFNLLDKPTSKWYELFSGGKGSGEGKLRGEVKLTVSFVSQEKVKGPLNVIDQPECDQGGIKRSGFGRFSLRKSLKKHNSRPGKTMKKTDDELDIFESQMGKSKKSRKDHKDKSVKNEPHSHVQTKKEYSDGVLQNGSARDSNIFVKCSERPTNLFISGAGSEHSINKVEENGDTLEGKVLVRLRRRRTISGSITPNTPARGGSFVYTNGLTKSSLQGAATEQEIISTSIGTTPVLARLVPTYRDNSEESGESPLLDEISNDRLKRFERRSLRLRDYQSAQVAPDPDSSPTFNPKLHERLATRRERRRSKLTLSSTNSSKGDLNESHSSSDGSSNQIDQNNKFEASLEVEKNLVESFPSEVTQKKLLSSSSSALSISSSSLNSLLQQTQPIGEPSSSFKGLNHLTTSSVEPNYEGIKNENMDPVEPNPDTDSKSKQEENQCGNWGQNTNRESSDMSTTVSERSSGYHSNLESYSETLVQTPRDKSAGNSPSLYGSPASMHGTQQRVSEEEEDQSSQTDSEEKDKPVDHDTIHTLEKYAPKALFQPSKEKPHVLKRRHTVQYSHGRDHSMDSKLPPSLMDALNKSPAGESTSLQQPSGRLLSMSDFPPRPHSEPHSPLVKVATSSSGSTGPTMHSSPLPRRSSSSRKPTTIQGITRLFDLSANAVKHKSTTLPRSRSKTVDPPSNKATSSINLRDQEQDSGSADRLRFSGQSGRSDIIAITPEVEAMICEVREMSREDLEDELVKHKIQLKQMTEELISLKEYNARLLEKVIQFNPELLESGK